MVFSDVLPEEINPEKEVFDEIITADQLGIPVDNLDLWIFEHSVVELCTAVKGQALVKFLEEGSEKVVYLDPDIAVFDDLKELEKMLDEYAIVLTPHLTEQESSRAAIMDNEICALKHGAYNFGFYAVNNSQEGLKFARWWRDRLVEFCFDDIPNGIFTDQKWGDLVPCLFEKVYILRDPGYNVATWNISNREMGKLEDGTFTVNGQPLRFYHFSGFDSGAQEDMLGLYAKGNKVLYELREWYIQRQEEEEQSRYAKYPSKYNFYNNGEKIEKCERTLIHWRKDVFEYFRQTNPYIVEQERSYYKWFKANKTEDIDCDNIDELKRENAELRMEINKIYSSKSWKILSVFARTKLGQKIARK